MKMTEVATHNVARNLISYKVLDRLRQIFKESPGSKLQVDLIKQLETTHVRLTTAFEFAENLGVLFSHEEGAGAITINLVKDIPDEDFVSIGRGGLAFPDGLIYSSSENNDARKINPRTKNTIDRIHYLLTQTTGLSRPEICQVFKISSDKLRILLETGHMVGVRFFSHKGIIMTQTQYELLSAKKTIRPRMKITRIPGTPLLNFVHTNGIGGHNMLSNIDPYAWSR